MFGFAITPSRKRAQNVRFVNLPDNAVPQARETLGGLGPGGGTLLHVRDIAMSSADERLVGHQKVISR